ncbi:MAG: AAA family ATPase [Pseudomonadota bacterium]
MTEFDPAIWDLPSETPEVGVETSGRTERDVKRWGLLTARVRDVALRNKWSKSQTAKRCGIPNGTFSQWYGAKYLGRLDETNRKVGIWLDSLEESEALLSSFAQGPGHLDLKITQEVHQVLMLAHQMSKIVTITLKAGLGKTAAAKRYTELHTHAWRVVASPHIKTPHAMLVDLVSALGIVQHHPAKLARSVGEWFQAKGGPCLLIIDEAQHLSDETINQLRLFSDEYGCGLALVGNDEIYTTLSANRGKAKAQLRRRIMRQLKRDRPYEEDVQKLIDGWKVEEPAARKFLSGIAQKPGGLDNVSTTLQFASILAAGDGSGLTRDTVDYAWKNRPLDELA